MALALLLVACGSETSAARQTVTVAGTGNEKSATVELSGNYAVTWTTPSRTAGCVAILTLESPTDKAVLETLANDETASTGNTNVYSLKGGPYFIDAELNDCGPWTVVLTPK